MSESMDEAARRFGLNPESLRRARASEPVPPELTTGAVMTMRNWMVDELGLSWAQSLDVIRKLLERGWQQPPRL